MPRILMVALAVAMLVPQIATRAQQPPSIEVYKTPTCGCCNKWVEHLRNNGFTVRTINLDRLADVKARHGVPSRVQSCHTGLIDGYVIEGHVPASDIHALLKKRPSVVGLAVPGMPIGSPGMEGANARPYDVVTFDKQGRSEVFATHGR